MKRFIGSFVAVMSLCLILDLSSFSQALSAYEQQAKEYEEQAAKHAAERDAQAQQMQQTRAEEALQQDVESCMLKLKSARSYLAENDLYNANDQLRRAEQDIERLKSINYDTTAFESDYNDLMQKAGAVNQSKEDAASMLEAVREIYFKAGYVVTGFDGLQSYGGVSLDNVERFNKLCVEYSEKVAAGEKYLAQYGKEEDTEGRSLYNNIMEFRNKKLPEFVAGDFVTNFKESLAKAKREKDPSYKTAAKLLCDSVLLLDPDNATAKKLKATVK